MNTQKDESQPITIRSLQVTVSSQNPQDDLFRNINEQSKIVIETDLTVEDGKRQVEPFKPQN